MTDPWHCLKEVFQLLLKCLDKTLLKQVSKEHGLWRERERERERERQRETERDRERGRDREGEVLMANVKGWFKKEKRGVGRERERERFHWIMWRTDVQKN